ncbi:centromere protein N [Brienomyrus brachyistius]|uniref:centromere protein N n=1 Tax=Brienomyrus brachyistius TaxID=42636 RepID=UPI0020B1E1BF|nr:centromere protein N [Brienomyrus brachyistius]
MDAAAEALLRQTVRRIPSSKLNGVLRRWGCLSETQLGSLKSMQPKWLLCDNLLSLCQENDLSMKHVAQIEMLYYMENPKRGIWYAFQMVEADDEAQSLELMHFRERFKAHLKDLISHVSIKLKKHQDESVWIRIAWGDNFHRPNHLKPTYVMHHLQTPYVFVSSLTTKHKHLLFQALVLAAGYSSVRDVHLSGRCLTALRDLLMRQYKQVFPSSCPKPPEESDPLPNPNIENEHAKVMEHKRQAAAEAFGYEDPPKLESATYKLETMYREHGNESLNGRDEPFRGVVKFTSSNLLESLKYCITSGITSTPLTPLLSSITQKGRNYFVIRDKGPGIASDTLGPNL